jgi:Flp pilus assembly CpaE family ATPase
MSDSPSERERGGGIAVLPRPSDPVNVLIAIRDAGLHHEVLDFLGRQSRLNIAGSTSDAPMSGSSNGNGASDVELVCPFVASRLSGQAGHDGPVRVMVTQALSIAELRTAIRIGARGVYEWPSEREQLADALAGARTGRALEGAARGRVIAVVGARGGAGVTFVATHLAAACSARGDRPVLVDADPMHSDLTAALGILPQDEARTVADLLPVIEELSPDHLEDVLFRHGRGFSVLLGPDVPDPAITPGLYRGAVALLAFAYDPVVVHIARPADPSARDIVAMADAVVLIASLDLLSIYGARRAMEALGIGTKPHGVFAVMNRAGRSPLGRKDVERLLGVRPAACIRPDSRIARAQERGRLLPPAARGAMRDVRRLAQLIAPKAPRATGRGA